MFRYNVIFGKSDHALRRVFNIQKLFYGTWKASEGKRNFGKTYAPHVTYTRGLKGLKFQFQKDDRTLGWVFKGREEV